MKKTPIAVDLFSGAGGVAVGLEAAGFATALALDFNKPSAQTYRRNFPQHKFIEGDIREVSGDYVLAEAGLSVGETDLLIGGPPCQGFSIIGSRFAMDPRNDLFLEFLRVGDALRPKCIVMENVPGLATLAGGQILQHILDGFRAMGYSVSFAELLAAQYGVPQMRWRMIFVAFRNDLGMPSGVGFPRPTHGRRGIGELVPNCTISPQDSFGFLTTRHAIGDLPAVGAGEQVTKYLGPPTCDYQERMRNGADATLHNHYAPRLSVQNLNRIAYLRPGQNWRDLPIELLPESMKRAKRKDHTRRFSRMTWEGVPRSIITRFRDPKTGEYTHPEQTRTISIREGARIQSFPDRFVFEGNHSEIYDQVGNAVPPILAQSIATEVLACLRDGPRHQLCNPFSRRKNLAQSPLLFDSL